MWVVVVEGELGVGGGAEVIGRRRRTRRKGEGLVRGCMVLG